MNRKTITKEECAHHRDRMCKVTTTGNIMEIKEISKLNCKQTIQRLNKDEGVVLSTGEKIQYNHADDRSGNTKYMAKSMKNLRDLINANTENTDNCLFATFTYAENMTDTKRLYEDKKNFYKRFRYYCEQKGYPRPEYISAAEPQGRGAWHTHDIMIFPGKAPFIPNAELAELWGFGFVTVKKLDNVDNVGAYLTAYLCDIPVEEAERCGINAADYSVKEVDSELGSKQKKKILKGARLSLYPSGMNFYRCSRGVKRPKVEWMPVEKANKKASAATLTYEKYIRIFDDEFSSDISYRYFNLIRGNRQDVNTSVCTKGEVENGD